MRIPKINWELTGNDPNDLVANYGHLMLRIERLRKGTWWYAITKGKNEIVNKADARCKKEAKNKVSKALLESFV